VGVLFNQDDPSDSFAFHAELEAEVADSVELTEYAQAEGAPVTAHKERQARRYTLRLVVVTAPLLRDQANTADLLDDGPDGELLVDNQWLTQAERWWERNLMSRLSYTSVNLGLVTDLDVARLSRSYRTARRLEYEVELRQALLVRSQTTRLAPPKRHKKPTTEPPEPPTPKPTSEAPEVLQSAGHRAFADGGPVVPQVGGRADQLQQQLDKRKLLLRRQDGAANPPNAADLRNAQLPAGSAYDPTRWERL
jgi:hypothetical protein